MFSVSRGQGLETLSALLWALGIRDALSSTEHTSSTDKPSSTRVLERQAVSPQGAPVRNHHHAELSKRGIEAGKTWMASSNEVAFTT
jgi:hypothetical protein